MNLPVRRDEGSEGEGQEYKYISGLSCVDLERWTREHEVYLRQSFTPFFHQNTLLNFLGCIAMLAIRGKARPLPSSKANHPLPQRVEMQGY